MTAPPALRRLDHIGIMVSDIDTAVEWYARALGLDVVDRWSDEALRMSWAHLDRQGLRIELVERQGLTRPDADAAGYHHLCLEVDDCEAATASLADAGGTVTMGPSRFERHHMTWSFVEDPFGNTIELVAYDPLEQTRRDSGTDQSRSALS